ncbi:MAG: FliA/WhiG family RNA polymerase sigma factor [Myxococcales bacterium FL481]|nr:MAG: FliA/WhiG family RNA polymerase sigma factor [Myxococcales bacterium FL481]
MSRSSAAKNKGSEANSFAEPSTGTASAQRGDGEAATSEAAANDAIADDAAPDEAAANDAAPEPAANEAPRAARSRGRKRRARTKPTSKANIDPTQYLDFVRKIASRMARNLPSHVALDDLIGAGILGLIDAMERYDPAKADRFETFAEFRVKGAILDELRRYDIMARNARLTSKRIARRAQELTAVFGRPPTDAELAKSLDLAVEDYRALVNRVGNVRVLSLDDLTGEHDTANDHAVELSSPVLGPDELTSLRELKTHLESALAGLPQRQQKIIDMYYHREMTLKQIGLEVGVTESRVCQIMGEATSKLRAMLRQESSRRG